MQKCRWCCVHSREECNYMWTVCQLCLHFWETSDGCCYDNRWAGNQLSNLKVSFIVSWCYNKMFLICNCSLGKIQGQNKLYKLMSMYYGNGAQTKPLPCTQCTFPDSQWVWSIWNPNVSMDAVPFSLASPLLILISVVHYYSRTTDKINAELFFKKQNKIKHFSK